MSARLPQDASKRQLTVYIDARDYARFSKLCRQKQISMTKMVTRIIRDIVEDVCLSDEENAEVNRIIASRIAKGYNQPFS